MKQFQGIYTALVTPFNDDGSINFQHLDTLVDAQLKSDVNGLVLLGTTAESVTLNADECLKIIRHVKARVNNKKPLIMGAGSNCTHKAIELTRLMYEEGAVATLQIAPYYNRPAQEGLYQRD